MTRPIGFDLADLTADDRRALRNAAQQPAQRVSIAQAWTAQRSTKRGAQLRARRALIESAKIAGGALACIGFVAYLAVFLGA